MAIIQWIIGTTGSAERLVGAHNSNYQDVLNRPLRAVLSASGLNPDADFPGFAIVGSAGVSASYALSASYAINAKSASIATVASVASFAASSSWAFIAVSASWAPGVASSVSSSYALTASYALNGGGGGASITSSYTNTIPRTSYTKISNSYTASLLDQIILVSGSSNTSSIYMPSVQSANGQSYLVRVENNNGWPVNIISSGSNTIDGFTVVQLITQRAMISLTSNGGNEWMAANSSSYLGQAVSVSSSYALTASYALNGGGGGTGISSSYSTTASYAQLAQNVLGSISSATSASYALTSSFALTSARTPVKTISGSYTASSDDAILLVNASFATASIYLPSVALNAGDSLLISKRDSGSFPVLIFCSGLDTIDGFSAVSLTTRYSSLALTSNGATHWMSGGSSSFNGTPVSASFAVSASYANVAQNVLGSITSASYALTASYALNGGGGGGATGINPILQTGSSVPTTGAGTLKLFAFTSGAAGNAVGPAYSDGYGNVYHLARHPGHTQTFNMYATLTTPNMVDQVFGSPTTAGSTAAILATGSAPAAKNQFPRVQFQAANAAQAFSGWMQSRTYMSNLNSYQLIGYFSLDQWHTDGRLFVGLTSSQVRMMCSSSVNGVQYEPSTALATGYHSVGICKDSTDTNIQVVSSDGTTVTKRDTGLVVSTSEMYRLTITYNAGDIFIGVMLEALTSGASYGGNFGLNLPGPGVMLGYQWTCGTPSPNTNYIAGAFAVAEVSR